MDARVITERCLSGCNRALTLPIVPQAAGLLPWSACARRATRCPRGPSASAGRLNAPHHSVDATHGGQQTISSSAPVLQALPLPGSEDGKRCWSGNSHITPPGRWPPCNMAAVRPTIQVLDARQPCVLRGATAGVWRAPHPRRGDGVAGPDQLDLLKRAYDDARAASPNVEWVDASPRQGPAALPETRSRGRWCTSEPEARGSGKIESSALIDPKIKEWGLQKQPPKRPALAVDHPPRSDGTTVPSGSGRTGRHPDRGGLRRSLLGAIINLHPDKHQERQNPPVCTCTQ